MLTKIYTNSDSFAQTEGFADGYLLDTSNPSLIRFRQGQVIIDCIGFAHYSQFRITLKIYNSTCQLKTFRQTVDLSYPVSIDRAVMAASNRLCIHQEDLRQIVGTFLGLLKSFQQEKLDDALVIF